MSEIRPQQPVVGGVLDPDDVVGRDVELRALLRHVASGGAYVVGDRRIGKTSILRRAVRDLREAGHVVVMVSAETADLATFSAELLRKIRDQEVFRERWKGWTGEFSGEVTLGVAGQGLTLSGNARRDGSPHERDLGELCAEAAEKAGAASFVLVIDEIAVLARFLRERDPSQAAEFLRWLRRLRQDGDRRMRVVLSGSVGLHHEVDDATVLNDLARVPVSALLPDDAVVLARRLLLAVRGNDDPVFAVRAARAVGDHAYYVQQLIAGLEEDPTPLDVLDVDAVVNRAIDLNRWDTDHYVTRVETYYPGRRELVLAVLDSLAPESLDVAGVARQLAVSLGREVGETEIAPVLDRLRLDHYLDFADGRYRFASTFLARVWQRARTRLR